MLSCAACAVPLSDTATVCEACGAPAPTTTALVSVPRALPARRMRGVLPTLTPRAGARLAITAMLPALAGLLAREGMRYLPERRPRETRLYRWRGMIVRQVNGNAETVFFDTEILGPREPR